jgi:hypothetical protein
MDCVIDISIFNFALTGRAASAIISQTSDANINAPTIIPASSNTLTKPRVSANQLAFTLGVRSLICT